LKRSRRLGSFLAVAGTVAIGAAARADAPLDQYGYFDMTAPTIFDKWTSLTWQRNVSMTIFKFDEAAAYCAGLSMPQAGFVSGWRVPSYKELLTLVDEAPHLEYENASLVLKWIDPRAFFGTPVGAPYWTSSAYQATGKAYVVDLGTGTAFVQPVGLGGLVRCVHDL
jgi:hypothetical protein